MSYRYNGLDVVVGVGFCAILFGAFFFMVATSGTFLVSVPHLATVDSSSGMTWLQPALGQAIVERASLQRRTDQLTTASTMEWNQAMRAHRRLQVLAGDPFGHVIRRAEIAPIDHDARVQAVLGRYIVNSTARGFRAGALAADQYLSDYNGSLIGMAESLSKRLDTEFASTWQPLLGWWIVEAGREYQLLMASVQEQLGTAIVHQTQVKTLLEDEWSANQAQLGSLLAAVDRSSLEPSTMMAATASVAGDVIPGTSGLVMSWPELPIGLLIVAALGLSATFWLGLLWSAATREAKASAEARRNAGRWVYRMAA